MTRRVLLLLCAAALHCGGDPAGGADSRGDGPPLAVNDTLFASANQLLLVEVAENLLANDSDPNGGVLVVRIDERDTEEGGTVRNAGEGRLEYRPADGFWGVDRFAYVAVDPQGNEAEAWATVHVGPGRHTLERDELGTRGFSLFGLAAGNPLYRGESVGDFNADGVPDLGFVRTDREPDGSLACTVVVVLDGGGFSSPRGAGTVTVGSQRGRTCSRVGAAGDVNGDGVDDLLIFEEDPQPEYGEPSFWAHVVFGRPGEEGTISLSELAANGEGFSIEEDTSFGVRRFDGVGDFDGDGSDDLAGLGTPSAGLSGGRRYVVTRDNSDGSDVTLAETSGLIWAGTGVEGGGVVGAGDINGDGFADVVFGSRTGVVSWGGPEKTDLAGYTLPNDGCLDDWVSTVAPGDFDGDGNDDVLCHKWSGLLVVYGGLEQRFAPTRGVVADGEGLFIAFPSEQRLLAAFVGDLNGDGRDDIGLTPALSNGQRASKIYVLYGGASGTLSVEDLEAAELGFVLELDGSVDAPVQGVGDMNGDGLGELLIGPHRSGDAAVFDVVFGVATGDTCCRSREQPGCTDDVVEACVCAASQACCDEAWGAECVALADECGDCGT